jgi:hypothetical protein
MLTNRAKLKRWKRFCALEHARLGLKYGRYNYSFHLNGVTEILSYYRFRDSLEQMLGDGHDLFEDTNATRRTVIAHGGNERLIGLMFCLKNRIGADGNVDKLATFLNIISGGVPAVACKLADRLRNLVQNIIEGNMPMFRKYFDAQPEFKRILGRVNDPRLRRMMRDLDWLFAHTEELMAAAKHGNVIPGTPAYVLRMINQARSTVRLPA